MSSGILYLWQEPWLKVAEAREAPLALACGISHGMSHVTCRGILHIENYPWDALWDDIPRNGPWDAPLEKYHNRNIIMAHPVGRPMGNLMAHPMDSFVTSSTPRFALWGMQWSTPRFSPWGMPWSMVPYGNHGVAHGPFFPWGAP